MLSLNTAMIANTSENDHKDFDIGFRRWIKFV